MLKDSARRGRPRTFDEDAALDSALDLFWRQGFRATTTRGLEAALDMSQPSIYNAFGSKHDLLLRAMERYEARVEEELLSILHSREDGYQAIEEFMAELARWVARNRKRGCLMVNLMVGDLDDAEIAKRVERYRRKIRNAFVVALRRSETDEDLVAARADLLLAAVLGLHITARTAGMGRTASNMAVNIGRQVSAWRTG